MKGEPDACPVACLLALAAVLFATGSTQAFTPACPIGKFNVVGSPLLGFGAAGSDSVTLSSGIGGTFVQTATGCQPILARRYKGTRKATKVVAQWIGCGIYAGRIRLTAKIDVATCSTMIGYFRYRDFADNPVKRGFTATRSNDGCDDGGLDTFAIIQQRIFGARGCQRRDVSRLVRPGRTRSAADRRPHDPGRRTRRQPVRPRGEAAVVPGDAAASFLSQKVHGELAQGEGSQMPLIGGPLSGLEVALIDAWINAARRRRAASPTRHACPPSSTSRPNARRRRREATRSSSTAPSCQPGQEQEGCLWIPTPNSTDFIAGRWEFHLNPGTHHFAILEYNRQGTPCSTSGR
jgi:hypothetical protein